MDSCSPVFQGVKRLNVRVSGYKSTGGTNLKACMDLRLA